MPSGGEAPPGDMSSDGEAPSAPSDMASGGEAVDMDYFLNEDDLFSDEAGVEGFYIF